MATFRNLYHASEVLRYVLASHTGVSLINALVQPPPETVPTTEQLRITLAWQQEHSTHRNDGYQRNADGTSTPPPVTLSLFFVITTYGEVSGQVETAHRLLGDALRGIQSAPTLTLPAGVPSLPTSNTGAGAVSLTHVPLTPELMEKLFSLFQVKHRPFMICEMSPVQLESPLTARGPESLVFPGGVRLQGPTPDARPTIARVTPSTIPQGGWLRVDGEFPSGALKVFVGGVEFSGAAVTVVEAGRSIAVQLPTSGAGLVAPGVHALSVATGTLSSEPDRVQVVPAGTRSLDAPRPAVLTLGAPVTLFGQGLTGVDRVFLWPDAGVQVPDEVEDFAAGGVTATSITVTPAGLRPGLWRMVARVLAAGGTPDQYTPYVVVEVRG